jgi:PAS domain-containing protein
MKKVLNYSLQTSYPLILAFYLIPLLLFSHQSIKFGPVEKSWGVLSLAYVLAIFGTVFLVISMKNKDGAWQLHLKNSLEKFSEKAKGPLLSSEKITPLHADPDEEALALRNALHEQQGVLEQIREELGCRTEDLRHVIEEKKHYLELAEQQQHDLSNYRNTAYSEKEQNASSLLEAETLLQKQETLISDKNRHIGVLEEKVQDLHYEIKTLLQLTNIQGVQDAKTENGTLHPVLDAFNSAEEKEKMLEGYSTGSPSSTLKYVETAYDASVLLERCVGIAEALKGAAHLACGDTDPEKLDLDNYALDLRRLCDSFRSENSSAIVLFSRKEKKLLFANNLIKALFGWSPEKFIKDFNILIQQGHNEWEERTESLSLHESAQIPLIIKTKSGQDILVQCQIGMISQGVFAEHIIGVIYPA